MATNALVAVPFTPATIVKRDGTQAAFDLKKIESAMARAGMATGEFGAAEGSHLASALLATLAIDAARSTLTVEAIQDAVELELLRADHLKSATTNVSLAKCGRA